MKSVAINARLRQIGYDFAACAIIILFHFTNYLTYTRYDRLYPDIIVVAGGLCAVALVFTCLLRIPSTIFRAAIFSILITFVLGDALFEFGTKDDISFRLIALSVTLIIALAVMFFIRDHANQVLIGGFFAMLVITLISGIWASGDPPVRVEKSTDNEKRPLIVHIVLDEYIGLAGMEAATEEGAAHASAIGAFFRDAGFRVFSNAYSRFFKTETSLAGALNFDSGVEARRDLSQKHYGFSLDRNEHLRTISERGYRIHIYQSDYLDLCNSEGVTVRTCTVYRPDQLSASVVAGLPAGERVRLLFGMYYSSIAVIKLTRLIEKPVRDWLSRHGIKLPPLRLWHGRVGPIAVAPTIERLIDDIGHARAGDAFFAHLLMPHYPYVYGADCSVEAPISSWRLRFDRQRRNTQESRRQSYVQYFRQLGCTQTRLAAIFNAMKRAGTYDSATIIIHGDHGSRIALADPNAETLSDLTPTDFSDAYSTLFAVKAPAVAPGIDRRMLSLPALMSYAASPQETQLTEDPAPAVFVPTVNGASTPVPMPPFSRGSRRKSE